MPSNNIQLTGMGLSYKLSVLPEETHFHDLRHRSKHQGKIISTLTSMIMSSYSIEQAHKCFLGGSSTFFSVKVHKKISKFSHNTWSWLAFNHYLVLTLSSLFEKIRYYNENGYQTLWGHIYLRCFLKKKSKLSLQSSGAPKGF